MDTEQQVRLNFLEEVEDYFDQIETVVLKLTTAELDTAEIDRAMRAAHSIKGGAGMMGFVPLSQIAHRLEDFFKILRVRGEAVDLTDQVESLFLQGIDALRLASQHSRQGQELDDSVMQAKIQPIFDQLRSHLGDLRPEDEDRLLAQEENVDVAVIIFSSGVEECLDEFEAQLIYLSDYQIAAALAAAAEQLAEFGRMSELVPFVQLCEQVQADIPQLKVECLPAFAQAVLSAWRRSHALVLIGRTSHLPSNVAIETSWLDPNHQTLPKTIEIPQEISPPVVNHNAGIAVPHPLTKTIDIWDDSGTDVEALEVANLDWLDEGNLSAWQEFVSNFDEAEEPELKLEPETLSGQTAATSAPFAVSGRSPVADSEVAPGAIPDPAVAPTAGVSDRTSAALSVSDNELQPSMDERHLPMGEGAVSEVEALPVPTLDPAETNGKTVNSQQNTTVRVSAQQLQQLNTLFGKLIVERNAIDLRLSQLHSLVGLMQDRMEQLEDSNHYLRQWYDRASTAGLMATPAPQADVHQPPQTLEKTLASPALTEARSQLQHQFDALEFDRYTDLHILSQEQMERIVQLQEVSGDIVFSLREASTATADLHYTTRALQSGMTKIQMRPFSMLVKRFPRVMRDLAVQHHKQVNLNLEGEMTLIDRVAIEALTDPLNHLLRNAFDHGIETPEERIAAGKPADGTITLRAMHRGNQTLITIQDDGRGIDPAKIRSRLSRLGMSATEVQQLRDRDLVDLIFEPGFSTAERVTELSGRGVGMDIVRTNLQQLRGEIRVDTQVGQGTTFTIQVPLAVSVLRVMLVESARMVFAVPIDSIKGMASLPTATVGDQTPSAPPTQLNWEGQAVDLIHLEDCWQFNTAVRAFEMEGTPTINQPTALMVEQGGQLQGICIDRFWGEQEISLSPVKSPIRLPAGFSGTSILGDGRVIPLIDPFQLLESILEPSETQSPQSATQSKSLPSIPTAPPSAAMTNQLPTLLVVDDSINVRRYLALTLEKAGYQVEQAKDGQEALDKLMAGLAVEAIICDIEMPRLDGYQVLSELRSRPEYQRLPIAMLTSRMSDKHRKLAMNLGASAYFSKPYNEQELLKTLQALIQTTEESSARDRQLV